ncbi:Jerky protein, partial [Stegodyphus mimosarum]
MDKGISVSKLCEEYGIGKSTVYDISRKKNELFEFFVDSDTPLAMNNRKRVHYAKSDDHDKVMIEWVRQRLNEDVPFMGPMLMAQAKLFHEEMNLNTESRYSTGWLTKFKNRHGIRQLKISGEKVSANTKAAEEFANEFIELITSEQLSPEQIYDADETGLFWQYVPPNILATSPEKAPTATIFHGEDNEDDSSEFEGFQTSQTKGEIFQLLDYVKKCGEAVINEDDITEVFHCDDNAPIMNQLTDGEICSMVLDPENTASDSEESDREVIENEKISIDKLVGILDTAITGLEQ